MDNNVLKGSLKDVRIHMVGIKGSGMVALAEILVSKGAMLTGSDVPQQFYSDRILASLNIKIFEHFSSNNILKDIQLVIYSKAYSVLENPDLKTARALDIPVISYPEAIGLLSECYDSSGISGVHGKTTTTAITGTILKALNLPVTILAGTEVPTFGNHSTLTLGDKYFIAETCEYKRHFLNFRANRIVITSIEMDHPDYFKNLQDIYDAFIKYGSTLPEDGLLIYNHDDYGTRKVVSTLKKVRGDIIFIPYGLKAEGRFGIEDLSLVKFEVRFSLKGFKQKFAIRVPGMHMALNAVASMALCINLIEKEKKQLNNKDIDTIREAIYSFKGSKRRSEVLGEAGGILFLDDYAHHPTAVYKTISGIKHFYPDRRIIVDFMSHTYSRTSKLINEFGKCFSLADEVVIHKIFSSEREKNNKTITGRHLFDEVALNHEKVHYYHEIMDAISFLKKKLRKGDIFITMGAGDNWKVGRNLFEYFGGKQK